MTALNSTAPQRIAKKRGGPAPFAAIGEGPAMAALNDRHKVFVRALFEAPRNHGAGAFAARAAGYGTETSTPSSIASMAYQLSCDPKIQMAIAEMSQQYVTTLGPIAVRALKKVLDNPSHRDFGRAIGLVIERVSPQQSTHTVKVEHDATAAFKNTAEVMARIAELTAKFKLGTQPVIIDAAANEVEP